MVLKMSKYNIRYRGLDEENKYGNLMDKIRIFYATNEYYEDVRFENPFGGEAFTARYETFEGTYRIVVQLDSLKIYKVAVGNNPSGADNFVRFSNEELRFFDGLDCEIMKAHSKYCDQEITDWYGAK